MSHPLLRADLMVKRKKKKGLGFEERKEGRLSSGFAALFKILPGPAKLVIFCSPSGPQATDGGNILST